MPTTICVSHATADRREAQSLVGLLSACGFRCRRISNLTDKRTRAEALAEAAVLLPLCSSAAETAETVAEDRAVVQGWGRPVVCIALSADGTDAASEACVPYPAGEAPDRYAVGMFAYALILRRLCGVEGIYSGESHLPHADAGEHDGVSPYEGLCDRDMLELIRTAVMLTVRAGRGDMDAAYALGCAYERGEGVPVLEDEAVRLIAAAAESGINDARIHLGELYLAGRGVETSAERAFRFFSLAADEGDLRGEFRIGLCYLRGIGVIKDPERAVHHFRVAARFGYPPALYHMGLLRRDGVGLPSDTAAAVDHLYHAIVRAYRRSSEGAAGAIPGLYPPPTLYGRQLLSGRRPACISLRQLRRKLGLSGRALSRARVCGIGHPEDGRRAWLTASTAAVPSGFVIDPASPRAGFDGLTFCGEPFDVADAALALGNLLESGGRTVSGHFHPDPTRALVWYRYAAVRGRMEAVYRLANAYRRGVGVPADPTAAVALYRPAAESGHTGARFALAVCFERGIGTDSDMAAALRFYEQAAADGYAPAQNNLGGLYEHGIGVQKNLLTAVEWYARAAGAGQPDALCRLGLCYENGRGVTVDAGRAFRLYEEAAEAGYPYAKYRLGVCYGRGTHPDRRLKKSAEDAMADSPLRAAAAAAAAAASNEVELADVSGGAQEQIPLFYHAVALWEEADAAGVGEAAYALALAYAGGYGVRRDAVRAVSYLRRAERLGCVQAASALGYATMEGYGTVRDPMRAVGHFERAVSLYRAGLAGHAHREALLPVDALSPAEAAGDAYYMLGWCVLHAVGEDPTSVKPRRDPSPERVSRARALFGEAAALEHVGALIALGDLYTYGLLASDGTEPDYYGEAAALGAVYRRGQSAAAKYRLRRGEETSADILRESSIHALMTLASRHRRLGDTARRARKKDEADAAYRLSWRYYSAAAEEGSIDALVGMAEYVYYGFGMEQDRPAARRLLETAETRGKGRIIASLWMGDFLRGGWCGECRFADADARYLRALYITPVDSEGGRYILEERRLARRNMERIARAEVLYRLSALRSVYFADDPERANMFSCLVKAVLLGHEGALRDLSRIYAFQSTYNEATAKNERGEATAGTLGERMRARRVRRRLRRRRFVGDPGEATSTATHNGWMSNYYTALWPEPRPFRLELRSVAVPSDIPAYVTAEVTPLMTIAALNYIGDCLFEGKGLEESPVDAVACYRRVCDMAGPYRRSQNPPDAVVWAQYSLGWCLLHGHGTEKAPREAIGHLTAAARNHARAAYTLGECYEHGIGVDAADPREAIKYYRKALKMGIEEAEEKVAEMFERLSEASET